MPPNNWFKKDWFKDVIWGLFYILFVALIPFIFKIVFGSYYCQQDDTCTIFMILSPFYLIAVLFGYHVMYKNDYYQVIISNSQKEIIAVVFPTLAYILILASMLSLRSKYLLLSKQSHGYHIGFLILFICSLIIWDFILLIVKKNDNHRLTVKLNKNAKTWFIVDLMGILAILVLLLISYKIRGDPRDMIAGGCILHSVLVVGNAVMSIFRK